MKWGESRSVVSDSLWLHGLYSPWNSPGQNTGVCRLSLLQGIFPIQRSNPGLTHCRQILYQLSRKGSPRILEWVAYPLLQGIFPIQELNHGLLDCRWILYLLSYHQHFPFNLTLLLKYVLLFCVLYQLLDWLKFLIYNNCYSRLMVENWYKATSLLQNAIF